VLNTQLVQDGEIPVYSANVFAPFGYINDSIIDDFSIPSVIWGIDGDWMTNTIQENTKFYPTDHTGVIRCKTSDVNPYYLCHILELKGKEMGFSRSNRASTDRIKSIKFIACDRQTQDKYMEQIISLYQKINVLSEANVNSNLKIKGILDKYLT
jgi:restriction endonuclease S subunit